MLRKRTKYRIGSALFVLVLVFVAAFGAYSGLTIKEYSQKANSETAKSAPQESVQDISAETVAYYTKVLAWFTGVLAIVSAVQFFFIYRADKRAAQAFREQARAARAAVGAVQVARDTERAYVSGGGYLFNNTADEGRLWFRVTVDNYGKTPGVLRWYAFEFCGRHDIPETPAYATEGYVRRPFFDRIKPGEEGREIEVIRYPPTNSQVVYGRHWFEDIWGKEHSCGFCLLIEGNAVGRIEPPNRMYTDLDTCLGHVGPRIGPGSNELTRKQKEAENAGLSEPR